MTDAARDSQVSVTYHTQDGRHAGRPWRLADGADGESVGMAGESGCGKSTLASTVLRLQPKNARVEGTILVDGQDVQTMRWGQLRAVRWAEAAIVFQGALHSLNPVQRIGDQIAEPIRLHDQSVSKGGRRRGSASCSSRSACRPGALGPTRTSCPAGRSSAS